MTARDVIAAMLAIAAPGAVGVSASCAGGGASNGRQQRGDMSKEANEQLRQVSAHPALEILIRTGTQHWAQGQIELVVHGDGRVAVTQRQATGTASFAGQLTRGELDAFGQALYAHRFTAARSSAPTREPGDTPVLLQLGGGGEVRFAAQSWDADRDADPDLHAILRAAEQLVHRVSAGKLGQP